MRSELIHVIADSKQVREDLQGKFLNGLAESRIAFVGRSNVGKSTLVNQLLRHRVARVSARPGKTREINFYSWPEMNRILVDLPGYGFAQASKSDRDKWARFIEAYLRRDENLEGAVVLLDARHGPTPIDLDAIRFLFKNEVPVIFVFTKVDKLKNQKEKAQRRKVVKAALQEFDADIDETFWVSGQNRQGLDELRKFLKRGGEDA